MRTYCFDGSDNRPPLEYSSELPTDCYSRMGQSGCKVSDGSHPCWSRSHVVALDEQNMTGVHAFCDACDVVRMDHRWACQSSRNAITEAGIRINACLTRGVQEFRRRRCRNRRLPHCGHKNSHVFSFRAHLLSSNEHKNHPCLRALYVHFCRPSGFAC